jgi:hypothetical protein
VTTVGRGRAVDDARQSADGKGNAVVEPRLELLPGPAVHADLAPLAALAVADQDASGRAVEVTFGEGDRLADSQAGAPQQDDER